MSLLAASMEECQMMDKTTTPDGYGGYDIVWKEGAEFEAAVYVENTTQTQIAQAQGVTAIYSVLTSRSINLQFHDVFKRKSDGKIFRVKTDGDDDKTPKNAGLNLRKVRAEEWSLV